MILEMQRLFVYGFVFFVSANNMKSYCSLPILSYQSFLSLDRQHCTQSDDVYVLMWHIDSSGVHREEQQQIKQWGALSFKTLEQTTIVCHQCQT